MPRPILLFLLTLLTSALPAQAVEPPPPPPPTAAVLYFDYPGTDASLAVLRKGLAQMLISDFAAVPGVHIVERDRLQEVLQEQKLSKSMKFDPSTAARVGKLLGAKYLVLGGYFSLGETLRVDARVVEVETGRVLKSVGASGKLADFLEIEQKLSRELGGQLEELTLTSRLAEPPRDIPKPPMQLAMATAVRYATALDLKDAGKRKEAVAELQAVVAQQPDFALAQADLQRMLK